MLLCAVGDWDDMEICLQTGIVPLSCVTDEAYRKFSLVVVPSIVLETTERQSRLSVMVRPVILIKSSEGTKNRRLVG